MDRRTLLRGTLIGAGGMAAANLLGCAPSPGPHVDLGPFDCGVASGVHGPGSTVLWTRFAPGATAATELRWLVAADEGLSTVVAAGTVVAEPDADGCAKVLVEDLEPGATYWYRFWVDGVTGPVGRTRTLPTTDAQLSSVRLGVASCQNYGAGYYAAWRALAQTELDAVIFLGDYIYESDSRSPLDVRLDPVEARDLDSYRAKYRLYRSDPDLRAAHAAHPFAPIWDDHEVANDYNRTTLIDEPDRAAAAYRAWFEYQPVMRTDGDRIHRGARWGRLVDLALLDTRQYRDPQPHVPGGGTLMVASTIGQPGRTAHLEGRTILGSDQRDWLLDRWGEAQGDGVGWKLVGNQVMFSPIRLVDLDEPALRQLDPTLPHNAGVYANFDDWTGYMSERDKLTDFLRSESIGGVGFLTGDIHAFFQSEVIEDYDDSASPTVAQEFVCGSVSSRGVDFAGDLAPMLADGTRTLRPRFRHADLARRGFGIVECTPERTRVGFHTVDALRRDTAAAAAAARRRIVFDWEAGGHEVTVTRN